MSDTNGHASLTEALRAYRQIAKASNRRFMEAKVAASYRLENLTDKQRLDRLAPYFGDGSWGTTGYGSSITSPQQLVARPGEPGYVDMGIDSDGTGPPKPEDDQRQYLDYLYSLLRELAGEDFEEPTEFAQLVTMADYISEKDFRQSGLPGIGGTSFSVGRNDLTDKQPEQREWYDGGWHVLVGWRCAYGNPLGTTVILYARKFDGTGTTEDQEWKWRVYTWHPIEFDDGLWFSSIADFLTWKSNWFERLPSGWEDHWLGPPSDSEEWSEGDENEDEDEDGDED